MTDRTGRPPLVAVDYLQKVAVPGLSMDEEQRLGRIVEGLKDLALAADLPVVAVSAADREGPRPDDGSASTACGERR